MKGIKSSLVLAAFVAAIAFLAASCASTTLISSEPAGAKVYLNGEFVGTTPYTYTDTKIVGSSTDVKIVKDGYAPYQTVLVRNEAADAGAIIGGCFTLVPFLWTMGYKPTHFYELTPESK